MKSQLILNYIIIYLKNKLISTTKIIEEVKSEIEINNYKKQKEATVSMLYYVASKNKEIKDAEKELAKYIKDNKIPEEIAEEGKVIDYIDIKMKYDAYKSSYVYPTYTCGLVGIGGITISSYTNNTAVACNTN